MPSLDSALVTPFGLLLRKHVRGGIILDIDQPPLERLVRFSIASRLPPPTNRRPGVAQTAELLEDPEGPDVPDVLADDNPVTDTASDAAEKGRSAGESAGDATKSAADRASETADKAGDKTKDAAKKGADKTKDAAKSGGDKAKEMVDPDR